MSVINPGPFFGPAPESVPLPQTPLTGVVAQIRFPDVFSISKQEFIADFQERIREEYPRSRKEQSVFIKISGEGSEQSSSPNWRFFDGAMKWRVSLTTNFLSIETKAYQNRADFTQRVGRLTNALNETIRPSGCTRLGVRFVDRIPSQLLEHLDRYVESRVLGFSDPEFQSSVLRSINESLFSVEEGQLLARWGMMPSEQSHDPEMMPPLNGRSWFLDTDVFQEFNEMIPVQAEDIENRAMQLASRAYTFFRWVMKDELIEFYRGNP